MYFLAKLLSREIQDIFELLRPLQKIHQINGLRYHYFSGPPKKGLIMIIR